MTDFQIYNYIYLFVVSFFTICAVQQYKTQLVDNLRQDNINNNNWGYPTAVILLIGLTLAIGLRPETGNFSDSLNYRNYYYTFYDGEPFTFDSNADNLIFDNLLAWWGSVQLGISNFFFLMSILYFGCMFFACKKLFPKDTLIAFLCYLGAFSTFSYSCNGFKSGVAASLFLLALSYYRKKFICCALVLISWGFHHSMSLPIMAFIISIIYRKPKIFFIGWFLCVIISALHISYFQYLFAGLTSDEKALEYLTSNSDNGWEGKSGFRFDFILYSAMPMIVGYYAIFKKKIKSKMYTLLLQLYLATNAVWVLCMYVEYNNRIAYLSWFLYPIVLIYPFVNTNWSKNRMKILSKVVTYHLLFTLFMSLFYYGGLTQMISI